MRIQALQEDVEVLLLAGGALDPTEGVGKAEALEDGNGFDPIGKIDKMVHVFQGRKRRRSRVQVHDGDHISEVLGDGVVLTDGKGGERADVHGGSPPICRNECIAPRRI